MATYFHGNNNNNTAPPEIQSSAEGLQTLYLMNPNYVPFSDSSQNPTTQHNMLLLNPNNTSISTSASAATHHAHALNLTSLSHAPPQHHLIGVTIPTSNIIGPANSEEISGGGFHGFAMVAGAPRVHYNLWGSMDSINDRTPSSAAAGVVTVAATASSNNSRHVGTVTNSAAVAEIGFHKPGSGLQQGLSLSLSSQHHPGFRSFSGEIDAMSPASHGGNNNNNNNGISSIHNTSVVLGSKYLKVAQELLDEVVNVGNNKGISIIEGSCSNKEKKKGNIIVESSSGVGDGSSGGGENNNNNSGTNNNKQGGELSTAQRQELQMKKSKLVHMLDEVEQRYRQYHHQMQVVISWFEQAAGFGAGRSYTCLALKTISKQFRCLKDAISWQIRATRKALGEEEEEENDDDGFLGGKAEGSSGSCRLRFVDQHLRQQRALQQLGMIHHHHNAWRPQRGLPERAVSILRAWLFEHFLHPYPKDSDKVMLAKQTGLTRSQVSNWFINARVRLWKPMVEEMYLEEVKDHNNSTTSHQDNNNVAQHQQLPSSSGGANIIGLDNINNLLLSKTETFNNNQNTTSSPTTEISNSNNISISTSPNMGGGGGHSGNFLLSPNTSKPDQNSQSSILNSSMDMESSMNHSNNTNNKHNGEANNNNNIKFGIIDERNHNVIIGGGYGGAFSIEDIGRFNHHHHHHHQQQNQLAPRFHGNGVSLTLGLPPSDQNNNNLPSNNQHVGFLSHNNMHLGGNNNENNHEFCAMNSSSTTTTTPHPPSSHSGTSYDNIDMQNRKRFAAQLLRDFVA